MDEEQYGALQQRLAWRQIKPDECCLCGHSTRRTKALEERIAQLEQQLEEELALVPHPRELVDDLTDAEG